MTFLRSAAAATILFAFSEAASAVTLVTGNFAGYSTSAGSDLVGQQGWTSNDSTDDLTFFANWNGNTAAGLGGLLSSPGLRNVNVTHGYGNPLTATSFSVRMGVFASSNDFPGRDSFGWTFMDTSSNVLMRVAFEPNASFANRMEVVWYGPTGTRTSSGFDIVYDASYTLNVNFFGSGADAGFNASVAGGGSGNFNGLLTGRAAAVIDTVGLDFDVTDPIPENAGDNYMLFNQLSVVPEPTFASLSLAAFFILGWRRTRRPGL